MNFLVETETWSGKGCQRDPLHIDGNLLLGFQTLFDEFEEVRGAGVSATLTKQLLAPSPSQNEIILLDLDRGNLYSEFT